MRRSRRYSPVDIGWKWAAIALAILSAIGILAVAIIGMFVVTKVDQIPGFERLVVTGKYRRPVDGVVKAVENLIPSRSPSVDGNGIVDVYQLQVKSKEIARIDDELVFFEKNFLTLPKNELNARRNWHDAKFLSGAYAGNVKISLRGTRGHWLRQKKSWRIKFPDEYRFEGMRRTHLILPNDRGWVSDYLFNQLARKHGLMALKDGFAALHINGIYHGLYYQIEHPDEGFLARYNRQSGPLLNDDPFLGSSVAHLGASYVSYTETPNQLLVEINRFLGLSKRRAITTAQIRQHVHVDKYITMLALARLFGTDHWSINYPGNVRIYHDPTTGRLEPIPWDTNCYRYEIHHKDEGLDHRSTDGLSRGLLVDADLQFQRNQLLWELVGPGIDDILAQYDTISTRISPYIDADNMKVYSSYHAKWEINERYRENLVQNAAYFRKLLEKNEVSVELRWKEGKVTGDLINWGYAPVALVGISKGKEQSVSSIEDTLTFHSYRTDALEVDGIRQPITLPSEIVGQRSTEHVRLHLVNMVSHQSFTQSIHIEKASHTYSLDMKGDIPAGIRYESGKWLWGPGEIELEYPVVSLTTTPLFIYPDTKIRFTNGSFLISHGQIIAEGTAEKPIEIQLPDSASVMGITAAPDTSIFRHVKFRGGGDMGYRGLWFTGALSIYQSPVVLESCVFLGTGAEDALNVKNANYVSLTRSGFINSRSDALDFDWSVGRIRDCWFVNSGSDHIDLSGSKVDILGNYLARAKDKGISVGEQSEPFISGNAMVSDSIGVAVKDQSKAVIKDNYFFDNDTAIKLYIKKSYFKAPMASLTDNYFINNSNAWVVVDGILEGEESSYFDSNAKSDTISKQINPPGWYHMQAMIDAASLTLSDTE